MKTNETRGSYRLCAECHSDYFVGVDPDGVWRCADCAGPCDQDAASDKIETFWSETLGRFVTVPA